MQTLDGSRFSLCRLYEVNGKDDEHQCLVTDYLANHHQDGKKSQDSFTVVFDACGQVYLYPSCVGEFHSPNFLYYEFFVQIHVVVVFLEHGGHHLVVHDHVEFWKFC